jgi:hypothetical protein
MGPRLVASSLACCVTLACAAQGSSPGGSGGSTADAGRDVSVEAPSDAGGTADAAIELAPPSDAAVEISPDAACAVSAEQVAPVFLPVDIIWMVDNSASMAPAIDQVTQGLNAFAAEIAANPKNLDYRVVMLSLRSKTNPVTVSGGTRYAVCIPPPLAGDSDCGNGPSFFQSSIDVHSTEPLEQFLGTLGQTNGYQQGASLGGAPWKQWLRPNATKTIVAVSDDDSRLSATDFETFAGGKNPFNSDTLPPGILDPSWSGLFDGYVFDALYGWGSDTDPTVRCTYSDGSIPPSSGETYTTLIQKTGGVRAKICDGASAWGPFFDAVAQAVTETAKLDCDLTIPPPSDGTIDPTKVNVRIQSPSGTTTLGKVAGAASCGASGGWYYDDDQNPTQVLLCPASCDEADQQVSAQGGSIAIVFGCRTIVK